jgi:DNA-binding response OmpR family regulator
VSESRRPALLLIHHDTDLLDFLTRVFEARGFAVTTAATTLQAMAHLEGEREYDVLVAEWDAEQRLGADVYRWALGHRFHLRGQFVFLADEVPPEFDALVAGHCLVIRPDETEEIVRVAEAAAQRAADLARMGSDDVAWLDADRPTLLLADDDPLLLNVMARLLTDVGYAVTPCESGNAAIARLDGSDFDVIVLDWHMIDGTGGDVYRWLVTFRPWLVERVVFLTGGTGEAARRLTDERPVIPKGQDAQALLDVITQIARSAKTHRAS